MEQELNSWSVYKHTSPSNKVYIGIAKDVKHRWRANGSGYKGSTRIHNAIQKYGWDNFEHEILYNNLTREEACAKEIELIKQFNSTDIRYGYNLHSGGESGVPCEHTKEKISKSLIGHEVSNETRNKISNAVSVPIICLDTMRIFKSTVEASKVMGISRSSIGKVCNGVQASAGGYRFAKLNDYENDTIQVKQSKRSAYKKVKCIETGKIYENISIASRLTNISRRSLSYACNGIHETSGGFHWEFVV